MEMTERKRIHILSVTGEPCQICNQCEPWSHRVQVEILATNTFYDDEILCPLCIANVSEIEAAIIYDHLSDRIITPAESLALEL